MRAILNFVGRMGVRNSSATKKAGTVESPKSHEKISIKSTIMQDNVIHALKPEI